MNTKYKHPVYLQTEINGVFGKIHEAMKELHHLPFWRVIKRERALCEIRHRLNHLNKLIPEIPDIKIGDIEFS